MKSKRRLVFGGYPCTREAWEGFLPKDCQQLVIPFADIVAKSRKADFKEYSRLASKYILEFQPTSVICHDFAVTHTLLAMIWLHKKQKLPKLALTVFNGGFRGFDVFKAPHPIRSQYTSFDRIVKEVEDLGVKVDARFRELNPKIRSLYRGVILFNLKEKLESLIKKWEPLGLSLDCDFQIIASRNDRYIPFKTMEIMRDDFLVEKFRIVDYGHFPYISASVDLIEMIVEHEKQINED